jgi:hypothetical protein
MPITLVQISYRPVRVAWLVRGRSGNDLRESIRLASCLWGGAFSLIADVGGPAETVDAAFERFRVDVLHPVVETDASRLVGERNKHVAWPLVGAGIVGGDTPDESGLTDLSRGLRLRSASPRQRVPVVPVWQETDEFAALYAATFGDLSHALLGAAQRAAYIQVTGAVEAAAAEVAAALDNHEVPLDAGYSGLEWLLPRIALGDSPGVFVGSGASLGDVRAFWNTRAVGTDVVFWDKRRADGGPFRAVVEARIRTAVDQQTEVPENFRSFPCYVVARSRERRPQIPGELLRLIAASGLHPSVTPIAGDLGIADWIPHGVRALPSTPDERVVAHSEDRGEERSRLTIELPRTPLAEERVWSRQQFAIQLETYGDFGYRGTLKLPYLPDLNSWYRWHIAESLEHLRVQDDAFSLIKSPLGPTHDVTPLHQRLLLEKLFERAGIKAKRSLPGEAAWHLLNQFGGYGGLRVLRLPGVRKLLSSGAARRGIGRGPARGLIHDRGRIAQADRIWIGGDELDAGRVWEFLLHRRIFLPGIETTCPWCQHASFYRPRDVDDELECPKCGRKFPLGPAIAGDPVRFRISGLLEPRPEEERHRSEHRRQMAETAASEEAGGHQPAAVPVLLTLLFLSEWVAGQDGAVFETSHDLKGEQIEDCESDFIALTYGARPENHTHVLIGECKGRGRITAEDVRKLSLAAAQVRASGIDCDIVFSTTRQAFTEDELALFREYHAASSDHPFLRRTPIVLTAAELDWNRYSGGGRFDTADRFSGTGFDPLVTWSTRHLMGEPSR